MIPITIRPARIEEWPASLDLALCHRLPQERGPQALNVQAMLTSGELDPQGLLVALDREDKLRGVVLAAPLAGGSGLVWPPQVDLPESGQAPAWLEDQLVQAALAFLRQRGARLFQTFLPPTEVPLAAPLERAGFRHITALRYLRHDLDELEPLDEEAGLEFATMEQVERAVFQDTLMRTYERTLDCPELTGVRSAEEVLAGHGAEPGAHPKLWWLVRRDGQQLGVVLLARLPGAEAWDLSYFGLTPEARGEGIGRHVVRHILHRARTEGMQHVVLAVDERNLPALNVYRVEGFQLGERREVYLLLP